KYHSVNQIINHLSPPIVPLINIHKAQNLNHLLKPKSNKSQQPPLPSPLIYQKNNPSPYILTNNHLIHPPTHIKLQFHNSKQLHPKLIGKHPLTHMPLLKINHTKGTKPIHFPNSSKLKTPHTVFPIGNPLPLQFPNSLTSPIISATQPTIHTQTSPPSNK
ncbi:S1C family serine protease, partial [Staphylococcus saprophyticus]|uniref:S1C family serine protease n=1 Tax=Staphylococcus saprophyticus TaxID=29385 RepID=UPI001C92DAC2